MFQAKAEAVRKLARAHPVPFSEEVLHGSDALRIDGYVSTGENEFDVIEARLPTNMKFG